MSVKGSCTICTDYFSSDNDVSVTFCGHLFHDFCLAQWLKTKGSQKNCPQCRAKLTTKQVVTKLYINAPDDNENDLDPYKLKNDVENLETSNSKLKREKLKLSENLLASENARESLKVKIKTLKDAIREEKTFSDVLRQQLANTKHLEEEARVAKEEATETKRKFDTMKKMEVLLNGHKDAVDEMIQQYTGVMESSPSVRQLATFCVTLKQEFDELKSRHTRKATELMKMKRNAVRHDTESAKYKQLNEDLEERLSSVIAQENILKEENRRLKEKIQRLLSAIESPSDTRTSVVSRLMHESPAPMMLTPNAGTLERKVNNIQKNKLIGALNPPIKKPRLSTSFNNEDDLILSSDDDSISTNQLSNKENVLKLSPSENTKRPSSKINPFSVELSPITKSTKNVCNEYGLKFVKMKSTLTSDASNPTEHNRLNLHIRSKPVGIKLTQKDSSKSRSKSSVTRVGYNGLGGHSKHIFTSSKTTSTNRTKLTLLGKNNRR